MMALTQSCPRHIICSKYIQKLIHLFSRQNINGWATPLQESANMHMNVYVGNEMLDVEYILLALLNLNKN